MSSAHAQRALVDYGDSSSEPEAEVEAKPEPAPRNGSAPPPNNTSVKAKRRRLPPLDDSLVPRSASEAEPLGPKRAKIVQGEWLCHVFVEVPSQPALDRVVQACHEQASGRFGSRFRPIGSVRADDGAKGTADEKEAADGGRPHISLTRPILLRAHERARFVQETIDALRETSRSSDITRFPVSFSRLDHLVNDDTTRDFLVLEVGAGWKELRGLADGLSEALYRFVRAKPYYEEARFHASIGFVPIGASEGEGSAPDTTGIVDGSSRRDAPAVRLDTGGDTTAASVNIAPAPGLDPGSGAGKERSDVRSKADDGPLAALVHDLQQQHVGPLRSCPPLVVNRIGIRVGKRITFVPL